MPGDAEKVQLTSLAPRSTQQLSTKASLVARGLGDIAKLLQTKSVEPDKNIAEHHEVVEQNQRYVICEDCGSEYSPGSLKLLPISEAFRFELWPEDMKMFFCTAC